ncbi:hypothetical protein BGZ80_007845 [Entomortierella chlamydospora]|uniref:Methyltransferase domain-containing protein n=1 Tax=Entomortierella chlamydospora TaxID=101097 RepID=A0A9P6N3F7_9FUNG|nr:hypothetical protein BGZ79_001563 [Entomortierella chlamydospora]KAG0023823.1 hypothetical protein BGZ80_007845 [Entomortierella chlamydospora]
MTPSISPLDPPNSDSKATIPKSDDGALTSFDPKKLEYFHTQYPDYIAEEVDLPLWIDGVDTTYAPFIPTSTRRVLLALEMAHLTSEDKVLDVGSGDGRFCYAAVTFFGAQKAMGIECEQDLIEKSTELAQDLVDQGRISFERADLTNWRESSTMKSKEWSVIVVFLSPEGGDDMEEWLVQEFERGVRIVALVFDLKQLKGLHCSVEDSQEGIWIYEKQK